MVGIINSVGSISGQSYSLPRLARTKPYIGIGARVLPLLLISSVALAYLG